VNVTSNTAQDHSGLGEVGEYRDMTSETETQPRLPESDSGEGDGYAHYANKTDITRAAVEGGRVAALCGFKFPPIRDPQRFPVCPRCKELAGMLGIGG
jgi:hypothetical protein